MWDTVCLSAFVYLPCFIEVTCSEIRKRPKTRRKNVLSPDSLRMILPSMTALLVFTYLSIPSTVDGECWDKDFEPAYRSFNDDDCLQAKYCYSASEKRWGFNPDFVQRAVDESWTIAEQHPTEAYLGSAIQRTVDEMITVSLPWVSTSALSTGFPMHLYISFESLIRTKKREHPIRQRIK